MTPLSILCSHGLHADVCECELLIVLSPIGNVSAVGRGSGLRVVGHGYCAALKECADLGFVVN